MTIDQALMELRSLPSAPETLRERVRALPEPQPRTWTLPRLELRRLVLVAAPAVVAVAFGAAALNGVLAGGTGDRSASTQQSLEYAREKAVPSWGTTTTPATTPSNDAARTAAPPVGQTLRGAQALPPSTTRLNRYQAWLRIAVARDDVADAATRAMKIARGYGGYVASVDMNTPANRGRAFLVLRIPVGKVEDAVLKLGAVGDVKAQRVRIDDLQRKVTAQEREIVRLNARIESLEAALRSGTLSEAERARLTFQLQDAKQRLTTITRERGQTLREGRLATVSVTYTAARAAAAKPDNPGRLERTAREAADFLVREVSWLLYALIVAGPIALLVLVVVLAARAGRRSSERRLLEGA
jgi:hypothetical protein